MRITFTILFFLIFTAVMAQHPSSSSRFFALRLKPHEDLKQQLIAFAKDEKLKAASIVSGVGSLEQFHLRFANQENGVLKKGHFEIVSLTGTFSDTSSHLHLSVSDSAGQTTGGHLLDQNLIYTTAEIVIVELTDLEFKREADATYGYQELSIQKRKKNEN
ncbi:MAG TPA: PPC domain-containing DNA-binding protein [Cyclobacteriaceae bacterium]